MKVKDGVLAIAIIVLTIFVTFYGINTLFPKPQYEDFCSSDNYKVYETAQQCEAIGGNWTPQEIRCITEPCPQGYCDGDYTCRQKYENSLNSRGKNVFLVALPLGILIIILGMFLFKEESVGSGLMGGGVGTLIYGSGAYWPYTENWVRFLISLIGLVILIWLVYYFQKKGKGKKKG